ncbi:MAG: hypothetical protein M0002_18365 [Rhodospirillales bacterium]|nr:hypothetical protein [Rhodospirillales bacterium]
MAITQDPHAREWLGLAGSVIVITGAGGGFGRTLMDLVPRPGFDRAEHTSR